MKIPNSKAGFTVLESIVAIMILSLSISGVFSAVQQGLAQTALSKEETRAFYLVQEAVEIIRNKRDSNQLSTINGPAVSWLQGIVGAVDCPAGGICRVDAYAADKIQSCAGSCENLKLDGTTYIYNYTSGNLTNINRKVQIESVNADEIKIIVTVSWPTKWGFEREFKVRTHLFNWI